MQFFVEGMNNLQASTAAFNITLKSFDDIMMVGGYLVGITGLSLASPTVSLFTVSRYISTSQPQVYSYDLGVVNLNSSIAIEANASITRAEIQQGNGLYLLFENGNRKYLYRINTATLTVTSMIFTDVVYPSVTSLTYLESQGLISVGYVTALNGSVISMRNNNHSNGLSQFDPTSLIFMNSSAYPNTSLSLGYFGPNLTINSLKTGLASNPTEFVFTMRNLINPLGNLLINQILILP
jgi:hypothetical protein